MTIPQLPDGFSWAENIALGTPEVYRLSQLAWPRFLLEESDIPDPILKFQLSRKDFEDRFKVYGVRQTSSGRLVAFVQAVAVEVDPSTRELPQLGWRFSIQNASRNSPKNALSLIEASVDSEFRGHGLAKALIERVKFEARRRGFLQVVAPVRPTFKTEFPHESMDSYCARKDSASRIADPWLRTHVEAGAEVVNICHNSVCVRASLEKWRDWTGLKLAQTGPTLLDGGLMPMFVDLSANLGVYIEPNVWVRYDLEPS